MIWLFWGSASIRICQFDHAVDAYPGKLRLVLGRDFHAPGAIVAGALMRPKEQRETGQTDLFRARLDQIVDPTHALVKLSGAIDWTFLETRFGAVYDDDPGRPPLPTRLMA